MAQRFPKVDDRPDDDLLTPQELAEMATIAEEMRQVAEVIEKARERTLTAKTVGDARAIEKLGDEIDAIGE